MSTGRVRVGPQFQAACPALRLRKPLGDRALQVWAPSMRVTESELAHFVETARTHHGYSEEQALGALYWHGHRPANALADLPNYSPIGEWSIHEKALFERAFKIYWKRFDRFKLLLPQKSTKDLVGYYYLWKKKNKLFAAGENQVMTVWDSNKENRRDESEITMDVTVR